MMFRTFGTTGKTKTDKPIYPYQAANSSVLFAACFKILLINKLQGA